jgi:hypothetical protein
MDGLIDIESNVSGAGAFANASRQNCVLRKTATTHVKMASQAMLPSFPSPSPSVQTQLCEFLISSANGIEDAGVLEVIASTLHENFTLQELDLSANGFCAMGAEARFLKKKAGLLKLILCSVYRLSRRCAATRC